MLITLQKLDFSCLLVPADNEVRDNLQIGSVRIGQCEGRVAVKDGRNKGPEWADVFPQDLQKSLVHDAEKFSVATDIDCH